MRNFRHLKYSDRLLIERLYKQGKKVKEIVDIVGFSKSTIYKELKLYKTELLASNLSKYTTYSADLSQEAYNTNRKKSVRKYKIIEDKGLLNYIVYLLKDMKYSPKAIIMTLNNIADDFSVKIKSVNTIYRAIIKKKLKKYSIDESNLHYNIKRYKRITKIAKRGCIGTSIEDRPNVIEDRKEFGHWEGDCVLGSHEDRTALFVLSERKTRYQIIEKIKSKSAEEIVKAINRIEKRYKKYFYSIFKSITFDNGVEFSNVYGIEKALYRIGKRTKAYYCHPYKPSERGTNENQNKLIRVWYPKGCNMKKLIKKYKVKYVEWWMNTYPREIFVGYCAEDLFLKELESLGIEIE